MSVLATSQCPFCGAPNYGTKFCEHCGREGSSWVTPAVVAPSGSFPALVLRAVALGAFLLAESLPGLVFLAPSASSVVASGIFVIFVGIAALALVVAALVGRASLVGRVIGTVAAVAYAVIMILIVYVPAVLPAPVIHMVLALAYLLLWGSWVIARPVRARAYLAALSVPYGYGWVVVVTYLPWIREDWTRNVILVPIVLAAATAFVILVTVRLARPWAPSGFPAITQDAPVDTLARVSLFLVTGGLVLSFLAYLGTLTGFVGFVVIGILSNLAWWGGTVLAFIGLYCAHRSGRRGAGLATGAIALGLGFLAFALLLGGVLGFVVPAITGGY